MCHYVCNWVKRLRLFGLLIAIIVLASVVFSFTRPSEPSYQGKTITEWLVQYRGSLVSNHPDTNCQAAIRAFGTNALPTLLRLTGAADSSLKAKWADFANNQNLVHVHVLRDFEKQEHAYLGFQLLGEGASPAVPSLVKLAKHSSPRVRIRSLICLMAIVPSGDFIRSVMVDALKDSDAGVRQFVTSILQTTYPKEAERLGLNKAAGQTAPPITNQPSGN